MNTQNCQPTSFKKCQSFNQKTHISALELKSFVRVLTMQYNIKGKMWRDILHSQYPLRKQWSLFHFIKVCCIHSPVSEPATIRIGVKGHGRAWILFRIGPVMGFVQKTNWGRGISVGMGGRVLTVNITVNLITSVVLQLYKTEKKGVFFYCKKSTNMSQTGQKQPLQWHQWTYHVHKRRCQWVGGWGWSWDSLTPDQKSVSRDLEYRWWVINYHTVCNIASELRILILNYHTLIYLAAMALELMTLPSVPRWIRQCWRAYLCWGPLKYGILATQLLVILNLLEEMLIKQHARSFT